jgi:hypothetical protein
LSLEELQSQLQAETKTLETLKGKGLNEAERRRHVVELEREQVWLEREREITKVIEEILQTGNSLTMIKQVWNIRSILNKIVGTTNFMILHFWKMLHKMGVVPPSTFIIFEQCLTSQIFT